MSDERRVVTVLFADVTGSTALGETLDPEDLRALLSRYYAIAKEVVDAHGGTVEKFIGDAVMAVFGLRRAHGDDAVRALSAALELRDRVKSDPRLGERMPIRLGVNTGDVVASRDAESDDFLVTGDAVNVAARLQQQAQSWSVLAGERTMRAAHGEFRFGPDQHIEAKGKSELLKAGEVLARSHGAAGHTPIFGRDADLAQMELVARRAFDERRPFLVTIIAPAGTGKTRLLEEFLARLPTAAAGARVAIAQCLPYGQRLTYWPLRAVLFRTLGLDEDAPATEVRARIGSWLAEAGLAEAGAEDARQIGDLLASTVGAGDSEIADRGALFAAWRSFIEIASRSAPLVVAVEDLHWSSDTLLDLFEYILQPRGDTRALLIALARPELLDRRPTWGAGRRNHTSIELEPLDDRATAQLVRTLAEGAPEPLVDAIVDRAEGNPFFAGEIVNAVLERLRSFDDPGQIDAALARLPDTVQATVLARLDSLPDDEREVLRVASVFGRSFRPAGVAALLAERAGSIDTAAAGASDAAAACERLSERDLIRPSGADGYTFRHILIREVAYSTLPRAARARLHGAAGAWLEERAAGREEALAELVAYHYREAAALASAMDLEDAEMLRDKARQWLVLAAQVARSAAASVEARAHVAAAIEFARPEDLPELYELFGDVEIIGNPSLVLYDKALEVGRAQGRPAEFVLRVIAKELMVEMRSQGSVATRRSHEQVALMREEGWALFEQVRDPAPRALFLAADAFYPFWRRVTGGGTTEADVAAAMDAANTAVELAQALDDVNTQSAALDALASLKLDRGEWRETVDMTRQRLALGNRLALAEQVDAYAVATWAATIAGDLQTASEISEAGLGVVQPGQAPEWTLHLIAWRSVALLLNGKWDAALSAIDQGRRIWIEMGRPSAGYAARGFIAGLIIARSRRDAGHMSSMLAVVDAIDSNFARDPRFDAVRDFERDDLPAAAAALGKPEARLGAPIGSEGQQMMVAVCNDADERIADEALLRGLEGARAAGAVLFEAEILRAQGLSNRDRSKLEAAHAIFQTSSAAPYVARTRCEIALLDGDKAELDAGLEYLETLGDVVQVERYLRRWSSRGS